jgi:hypothetical protein
MLQVLRIEPFTFTMINQVLTNGLQYQKVSNFGQVFYFTCLSHIFTTL